MLGSVGDCTQLYVGHALRQDSRADGRDLGSRVAHGALARVPQPQACLVADVLRRDMQSGLDVEADEPQCRGLAGCDSPVRCRIRHFPPHMTHTRRLLGGYEKITRVEYWQITAE